MDDQTKPPSIPPDDDPASPTQPGKRLRKLMAGSEINDATMGNRVVPTGPLSSAGAEPPPGETITHGATLPIPAADTDSFSAVPPAPGAPMTDGSLADSGPAAGQPGISSTQRHPTGMPDSTGGWYTPGQSGPYGSTPDSAQTRAVLPDQTSVSRASSMRDPGRPLSSNTPPPPGIGNGDLPRRVEEVDPHATQVTPAAYQSRRPHGQPPVGQPQNLPQRYPPRQAPPAQTPPYQAPYNPPPPPPPAYARTVGVRGVPSGRNIPTGGRRTSSWKRGLGCALRLLVALLFMVVFVVVAAGS